MKTRGAEEEISFCPPLNMQTYFLLECYHGFGIGVKWESRVDDKKCMNACEILMRLLLTVFVIEGD